MKSITLRYHQTAGRCAFWLRRHIGPTLLTGLTLCALPAAADDAARLEKLDKENQDLKRRLDAIEALAQKEGLTPSGKPAPKYVSALTEMQISGFVTASYFYDTSTPLDQKANGYIWNTHVNSFTINKVKLTLASKPVERSGTDWGAGYRVSLIFGEDANIVNTGGEQQGLEALREAYVEMNAPVGTGLNIRAGQMISLLNYESGDGGAVNGNFSQGFQWYYTGNGPGAGVQAGYNITESVDAKLRVQNGMYAGAIDNNEAKTLMGSIGIKPDKATWLSLVGFGGNESSTQDVYGASVLGGRAFGSKITTGFEFDWFRFDLPGTVGDLYSAGAWFGYQFTPKVGAALRGEYLWDPDGVGIKNVPIAGQAGTAITSPDAHGNLASIALTLNYFPVTNVKVQPEVRFDTTTYKDGFDGKESRVIMGVGISYLF